MTDRERFMWVDGKLVESENATINILTHSLHYGLAAFEGIRSYELHNGKSAIFRLDAHIKRFFDTWHIAGFEIPYKVEEICNACKETLIANGMKEGYIRPLAFLGEGSMGVFPASNPTRVAIAVWKWGKYLGEGALEKGVRAKVSSFNRYHPNTCMTRGKFTGSYATSVMAKVEARRLGFDEAILLDTEGFVSEGSGENIFIVRNGTVKTTPLTNVLPGVTRDTVITLLREMGYEVQEQRFTRDEMYIADEVFFTGTAAEITPIREIDFRTIGAGVPGQVTRRLQQLFFDIVRGKNKRYTHWLSVYEIKSEEPKKKVKVQ